ncbi:hypothetical protein F3G14_18980, partial [Acinetobacter baumannii]
MPANESELNEHVIEVPFKKIRKSETRSVIKNLDPHKSPGYDLITATILKELPQEGITFLTQLYNAIFRLKFVPHLWKVAQIKMIPKPGKSG